MSRSDIEKKVPLIAGEAVNIKGYVSAIDVLVGLGWLENAKLDDWRHGRIPYLESVVIVNFNKISFVMKEFHSWARHNKLKPSETVYKRYGKVPLTILKFSKSRDPQIEKAYRTHFVLQKSVKFPMDPANSKEGADKVDSRSKH